MEIDNWNERVISGNGRKEGGGEERREGGGRRERNESWKNVRKIEGTERLT